jgi:hypothetical protein
MRGFVQFMVRMAMHAAAYTRSVQLKSMVGQQQVWTSLETFTRQIHSTLNPTEVSYLIANEGRRLAEADRVSVAVREGPHAAVLAISGADVVEKRSNLVQLMRALFDAVLAWGEKLIYSGARDDTLPPAVRKGLDAYLAESASKLLVVLPLRDERETNKKKPPRSALMMECFEPATAPEQMVARLEVVARHATPALYNASEYKRIPMRILWLPLARLQEGLGGKARFILTMIGALLVILIGVMVLVPYPLRMEAHGQLLPLARAWVYPPVSGSIEEIKETLKPNARVRKNEPLILMYNHDLADKITELKNEIEQDDQFIRLWSGARDQEKEREVELRKSARKQHAQRLEKLINKTHADSHRPGYFWVVAPMDGIILSADFREQLVGKGVKENEPLFRIGNAESKDLKDWEIELKIPQKSIGQVLGAYGYADVDGDLDVDLLLVSAPTRSFRGKLHKTKVAKEATPNRTDNNEPEPVVIARVRIHAVDDDIAGSTLVPEQFLLTGTEVHARIRCGNHAMGYSLFYGVWEFFYEKVVFFF